MTRVVGCSLPIGRALVAALTLACACGGGPGGGERPNVLLVTIDTLRADHLGAWGYGPPTSPAIDRLAASGVRFARAVATAPETAPAVASLLTGRYQPRSGVRRNGGRVPDDVTTLAELAAAGGWHTAAIVCNPLLVRDYGFHQGFADWLELERDGKPTDDRAADAAIARVQGMPEPWLLWIHFMDPHGPYTAADPALSAGFAYPADAFGADPPLRVGRNVELGVIPRGQEIAGFDRLSQYVRRYDGEIRFTDGHLDRVLDALAARGQEARTLIALAADHGESLTEHDEYLQHGWFVYETTAHVPLVLAWPGRLPAGRVVETRVSGVDLLPTVAALAGIGSDAAAMDGTNLVACFDGPCERPGPVWSLGARDNHALALYDGDWKLVQTPGRVPPTPTEQSLPPGGFATTERLELYRVDEDPGETTDRAAAEPARVHSMRAEAVAIRRALRARGWEWYPGTGLPVEDGAHP